MAKQMLHYVQTGSKDKGEEILIRRPVPNPRPKGFEFDANKHFGHWERRGFLEMSDLGEFAVLSIEDLAKAQRTLAFGLDVEDEKWFVSGGYIRDEGAVFIAHKTYVSDEQYQQMLRIHFDPKNQGDMFKLGKRCKRIMAHHPFEIRVPLSENAIRLGKHEGDLVLNVMLPNGEQLRIKYSPGYGVLTEGMHLVDQGVFKKLKDYGFPQNMEPGDGFMGTWGSRVEVNKGHGLVVRDSNYDFVLFGGDKNLKIDDFYFGILNTLHPGPLFTDVQAVVNFQLDKFLPVWAERFMLDLSVNIQDESWFREMLGYYRIGFHMDEHGNPLIDKLVDEDHPEWVVSRFMRAGGEVTKRPAIMRRLIRTLMRKVMDCYTQIRVPVPRDVGVRRYAVVDPSIFNSEGEPTRKSRLVGNQVCLPGHIGQIAFHRQPSAHQDECYLSDSIAVSELLAIDKGIFIFMGPDMVGPGMKRQGDGDLDDAEVCYTDQEVVDHFLCLNPYPIQEVVNAVGK